MPRPGQPAHDLPFCGSPWSDSISGQSCESLVSLCWKTARLSPNSQAGLPGLCGLTASLPPHTRALCKSKSKASSLQDGAPGPRGSPRTQALTLATHLLTLLSGPWGTGAGQVRSSQHSHEPRPSRVTKNTPHHHCSPGWCAMSFSPGSDSEQVIFPYPVTEDISPIPAWDPTPPIEHAPRSLAGKLVDREANALRPEGRALLTELQQGSWPGNAPLRSCSDTELHLHNTQPPGLPLPPAAPLLQEAAARGSQHCTLGRARPRPARWPHRSQALANRKSPSTARTPLEHPHVQKLKDKILTAN